jgi:hypothetical protein
VPKPLGTDCSLRVRGLVYSAYGARVRARMKCYTMHR